MIFDKENSLQKCDFGTVLQGGKARQSTFWNAYNQGGWLIL